MPVDQRRTYYNIIRYCTLILCNRHKISYVRLNYILMGKNVWYS